MLFTSNSFAIIGSISPYLHHKSTFSGDRNTNLLFTIEEKDLQDKIRAIKGLIIRYATTEECLIVKTFLKIVNS